MTDANVSALIYTITPTIASATAVWLGYLNRQSIKKTNDAVEQTNVKVDDNTAKTVQTSTQLTEVHKQIDGRMEQLTTLVAGNANKEGQLEGRDFADANHERRDANKEAKKDALAEVISETAKKP
jgi:hypothetical protein